MLWAYFIFEKGISSSSFKLFFPSMIHLFLLNLWWTFEKPLEVFSYTFFSVSGDTIGQLESIIANNGDTPVNLVTETRNMVQHFSGFKNLVTVITVITIVFIFIKYAYVIFANFFLQIKDNSVGTLNSFIKKLLISLLICLVSPTILINGFLFFTALGMSAYSNININNLSNAEVVKVSFLRDSLKYGISPTTYCDNKVAQTNFGSNASKEIENLAFPTILRKDSDSAVEKDLYQTWCGEKLTYEQLNNSSLSYMGKWAGEYPAMIGQTLIDKVFQSNGSFYVNLNYSTYETAKSDIDVFPFFPTFSNIGIQIISNLVYGIYPFIVLYATAKNFANLISLIVVMWLYIQAYINDSKGNAFQLYVRKISTIFLTQFFIIALFYISSSQLNVIRNNPTTENLIMTIALIIATTKGSSLINEIVNVGSLGSSGILGMPKL